MAEDFMRFQKFMKNIEFNVESELHTKNTELEIIKQVPEITLPNQFYYVVNNKRQECVHVTDSITELTGYTPEEWTVQHMLDIIHPDDKPFIDKALYACYKIIMSPAYTYKPIRDALIVNYRIRHKEGHYIHILRHAYVSSVDARNQMVHNTSICMVISDFKFDNKQTVIMKEGNEILFELHSDKQEDIEWKILSKREKEVVELLSLNKTSEQIGKLLYISKHTVDTHRRKILKKLNIMNTTELLFKYIYKSAYKH